MTFVFLLVTVMGLEQGPRKDAKLAALGRSLFNEAMGSQVDDQSTARREVLDSEDSLEDLHKWAIDESLDIDREVVEIQAPMTRQAPTATCPFVLGQEVRVWSNSLEKWVPAVVDGLGEDSRLVGGFRVGVGGIPLERPDDLVHVKYQIALGDIEGGFTENLDSELAKWLTKRQIESSSSRSSTMPGKDLFIMPRGEQIGRIA